MAIASVLLGCWLTSVICSAIKGQFLDNSLDSPETGVKGYLFHPGIDLGMPLTRVPQVQRWVGKEVGAARLPCLRNGRKTSQLEEFMDGRPGREIDHPRLTNDLGGDAG
jgi:hypothetical protein